MSKSTKIVVSLLVVAGFVCLAIGTIFACDYISQSNNSVALDKKQVIVASANRFALPNVRVDEPIMDIQVPDDGFPAGTFTIRFGPELAGPEYYFSLDTDNDEIARFTFLDTDSPSVSSYIGNSCSISLSGDDLYLYFYEASYAYHLPFEPGVYYFFTFSIDSNFYVLDGADQLVDTMLVPSDFLTYLVSGSSIVENIVAILVSGLTGIGQGLGESLSPIATAIFVNTAGDGLSVFGILIAVFAAISLGLSFTRFVLNFVTSWGNRNR